MIRKISFIKLFPLLFIFAFLTSPSVSAQTVTPLPTPVRPTDLDFTPLRYHCRQETSPEFHPLRPYPASPCDPLIPRQRPRANEDDSRLYLTPYCSKSLNVWGTVTAPDVVDTTGNALETFPTNWRDATMEELYLCRDSYTDICFVKQIDFSVTWDFQDSQFPILGNTQDYLIDVQKVNQYLDWYLNGTVQQSEQIPLDMDNPEDAQRLTTFGGPVKKLLPFDAQVNLKEILTNSNVGTQYHDYDIENPFWPNTPFSSQEDITAEATVGTYIEDQPISPQIDGTIVSIGLTIGSADSRLYFPHLRSSRALSDLLSSTLRPHPEQLTSTDPQVVTQQIAVHQGPNPPVPGGDDNTVVQIAHEYPAYPRQVTRNTEVREANAAPLPILEFAELPGDSGQRCDLPAPTKPGDDLVGSQIHGTLTYVQLFRYTPQIIIADSCSGMGANCRSNCLKENEVCSTSATPCCYESCPPPPDEYCDGPDSQFFPCSGRSHAACVDPCYWEVPVSSCRDWPDVELDTGARAATFTKTPLVDKLYDTLVIGPQSILRRFLPQRPASSSGEYLEGETDLNNAKEVATTADYSGNSFDVNSPRVDAGNGGSGALYFPRLQSLFRHFLGGNVNLNNNLQCLLRPLGQCQSPLLCSNVFDSFADSSGPCGICNADSDLGPLAQRILARAGEEFNVPAANIWTAMWHEGATWPEFLGQFTDENVRKWSLPEWCGGEPMPQCDNTSPGTQPPFGWLEFWFYNGDATNGYWSAVQTVDPSRDTKEKVSRCNFMDAAFATAKSLQAGSAMWADNSCNPPFTFTNTRPGACTGWTADKVAQSQRAYGGCALIPGTLTCSRCQYENVPYTLSDLVGIFNSRRCFTSQ